MVNVDPVGWHAQPTGPARESQVGKEVVLCGSLSLSLFSGPFLGYTQGSSAFSVPAEPAFELRLTNLQSLRG